MRNRVALMLIGGLLLASSLGLPAVAQTTSVEGADGIDEIGPGAFLVLADAVRMLRIDVLEQRLERTEERIERLDRELQKISGEIEEVEHKLDAAHQELMETDDLLAAPEIEAPQRDYLEAMREGLDRRQSDALGGRLDRLEAEEDSLNARRRELSKNRKRLLETIQGLRSSPRG